MNLKTKLKLSFVLVISLSTLVLFFLARKVATVALHEESFKRLVAVREDKANRIKDLFKNMGEQIQTVAANPLIIESMINMKDSFKEYKNTAINKNAPIEKMRESVRNYYVNQFKKTYLEGNANKEPEELMSYLNSLDDNTIAYQYHYISNNEHPLGNKHELFRPNDNSPYSDQHQMLHPYLKKFLETFGYYDIFLIDEKTGHIVYSVFKELDFATSLSNGPYKSTNFADLFRTLRFTKKDKVEMVDLKRYFPSYEAPAGFIGAPIFNGNQRVGILIFQIPVEKIDRIMTNDGKWVETGYGDSAETYLVGSDYQMRSMSRFLATDLKEKKTDYYDLMVKIGMPKDMLDYIKAHETTTISQEVKTKGVVQALSNKKDLETATDIFPDYRGVPVMSAYTPINLFGTKWALMSEIDEEEALRPIDDLTKTMLFVSIGIIFAVLVFAWIWATKITNPIIKSSNIIESLSQGNLNHSIDNQSKDEIGKMMRSLDNTLKAMREIFATDKVDWEDVKNQKKREEEAQRKILEKNKETELALKEAQEATINAENAQEEALKQKEESDKTKLQVEKMMKEQEERTVEVQRRVEKLLHFVQSASEGDLTKELVVEGDDEVGSIGAGLKKFFQGLKKSLGDINDSSIELNKEADSLRKNNQQMEENCRITNTKVLEVETSAEKINMGVQNVARNMSEMLGAIREIAKLTRESNKETTSSLEMAKNANDIISQLGDSSKEIGNVIKTISSIAEQTNLLALNATIEAARAGEAGKGFSVVANEVKELANQTAKATNEITQSITRIQADTKNAVQSISEIGNSIGQINRFASDISAAIEEQEATTNEVTRIVNSSAEDAQEIVKNLTEVKSASDNTIEASETLKNTTQGLGNLSGDLQGHVEKFKVA